MMRIIVCLLLLGVVSCGHQLLVVKCNGESVITADASEPLPLPELQSGCTVQVVKQ